MSSGWNDIDRMARALREYSSIAQSALYSDSLLRNLEMRDALTRHQSLVDMVSPSLRLAYQQSVLEDAISRLNHVSSSEKLLAESSAATILMQRFLQQEQMFERLVGPQRTLASDLSVSVSAAIEAARTWSNVADEAVQRFHNLGLLGRRDDYIQRLLSPSSTFSAFAASASERLGTLTDPWQLAVGNTAFELISEQYEQIGRIWEILPAPADEDAPSEEGELNAPLIQFEEAIALTRVEGPKADRILLITSVQSMRCVADAQAALSAVFRANDISMSASRSEIFKPTTRFAESCSDLPWLLARDKKTFGNLLDALYFIFYEAPGAYNLRFLKANGGPLNDEDCDFIWIIKHLRNKYSRHDPDHGHDAEIAKSWERLQQKWESLGLGHAPFAEGHFMAAQEALMRIGREFMEKLLASMSSGTVQ